MKIRGWISALLILILLQLIVNPLAFASPQVWVTKSGNNVWTVYGQGLENIGGVFLNISYENLVGPVVTKGSVVSGALATSNVMTPGIIRFAAVNPNPFSKSAGDIATITFGGGNGKVTGISSELATANDNNPTKVGVNAEIRENGSIPQTPDTSVPAGSNTDTASTGNNINNNESSNTNSSGNNNSTNTSSTSLSNVTSSTGQSAWLGGVSMPTAESSTDSSTSQSGQAASSGDSYKGEQPAAVEVESSQSEPESRPVENKKSKKAKFVTSKSVLESFKEYKGERLPKEMLGLFASEPVGYKQIPAVFLADGKAVVKITIPVDTDASAAPNFAMSKEAKMASFPKIEGDVWVVQLRPNSGVYQATLSYFLDDVTADISVTVAPEIESYGGKLFSKMSVSDAAQFLKNTNPGKPDLSRDLNGDNTVDYIDDYIFMANYLVKADQTKTKEEQKKTPELPPVVKPAVKPAVKPSVKPDATSVGKQKK